MPFLQNQDLERVRFSNCHHFDNRSHADIESDSVDKKNGMSFLSPLLNLPYVKLSVFLPPDPMHDIFEGISHLILCIALQDLLRRRIIGIEGINNLIIQYSPFSPAVITIITTLKIVICHLLPHRCVIGFSIFVHTSVAFLNHMTQYGYLYSLIVKSLKSFCAQTFVQRRCQIV